MAFTFGFYNSMNGDRKYNAEQVSELFDGLIHDGVFDGIGQIFAVTAAGDMRINVGTGRAWFNHTWNKNDSVMVLTVPTADVTRARYDAVVLEVNAEDETRENTIKIVKGPIASTPVKPSMTRTEKVNQYPLAYIKVNAGATVITASNIEIAVGRGECPFVTGIIDSVDITDLFNQWNGDFEAWFSNVKAQLTGNVVTNLQRQIDELREADNILISDSAANEIGVPADSSVEYVLKYLNNETITLVNAIKNSASFIKTADYTYAGTYTHVVKGTKAYAIIIGGGGNGNAAHEPTSDNASFKKYGGSGGKGGGSGDIKITDIQNVSKNTSYKIVVGGVGGTSSAFGVTASTLTNGGYGGGGFYYAASDGAYHPAESGSAGTFCSAYDRTTGISYYTYSGGGGGGGGGAHYASGTWRKYANGVGGTASSGAGKGGVGGTVKLAANDSMPTPMPDAADGEDATTYGCGGGGGGGSSVRRPVGATEPGYPYDWPGGRGGYGYRGRVIIYEAGIFEI